MLNFPDATYLLEHFRADVWEALKRKFGESQIKPTNKTFNIRESNRRLDADATVSCQHRLYTGAKTGSGEWAYHLGVETRPINEPHTRVINWHEQHYNEGVKKNDATNRRFKRIVRILKRLRDEMKESSSQSARSAAEQAPSFLIECLVYNAPNTCFNQEDGSYFKDVQSVISDLLKQTETDASCGSCLEVSRMKNLFGNQQPWTRQQARCFFEEARNYVGFGS